MTTIDARGRSCPEPVILTKKALESAKEQLQVLVDNQVAVDNITRLANSKGLKLSVEKQGADFALTIG